MTPRGLSRIAQSRELSGAEKSLILDWQFGSSDSFIHMLFDLIAKADEHNQERLTIAYPAHVVAFRSWAYGDLGDRVRRIAGELL